MNQDLLDIRFGQETLVKSFQLQSCRCCLFMRMFYENVFVVNSRDGVPPYRYHKQHRREMHESAKANGRVPLPHIPVSYSWVISLPSLFLPLHLSLLNCLSLPYFSALLPLEMCIFKLCCVAGPVMEYKNSWWWKRRLSKCSLMLS